LALKLGGITGAGFSTARGADGVVATLAAATGAGADSIDAGGAAVTGGVVAFEGATTASGVGATRGCCGTGLTGNGLGNTSGLDAAGVTKLTINGTALINAVRAGAYCSNKKITTACIANAITTPLILSAREAVPCELRALCK
jgi:hypothetical protein